jgi:hypothetical protein
MESKVNAMVTPGTDSGSEQAEIGPPPLVMI